LPRVEKKSAKSLKMVETTDISKFRAVFTINPSSNNFSSFRRVLFPTRGEKEKKR